MIGDNILRGGLARRDCRGAGLQGRLRRARAGHLVGRGMRGGRLEHIVNAQAQQQGEEKAGGHRQERAESRRGAPAALFPHFWPRSLLGNLRERLLPTPRLQEGQCAAPPPVARFLQAQEQLSPLLLAQLTIYEHIEHSVVDLGVFRCIHGSFAAGLAGDHGLKSRRDSVVSSRFANSLLIRPLARWSRAWTAL